MASILRRLPAGPAAHPAPFPFLPGHPEVAAATQLPPRPAGSCRRRPQLPGEALAAQRTPAQSAGSAPEKRRLVREEGGTTRTGRDRQRLREQRPPQRSAARRGPGRRGGSQERCVRVLEGTAAPRRAPAGVSPVPPREGPPGQQGQRRAGRSAPPAPPPPPRAAATPRSQRRSTARQTAVRCG